MSKIHLEERLKNQKKLFNSQKRIVKFLKIELQRQEFNEENQIIIEYTKKRIEEETELLKEIQDRKEKTEFRIYDKKQKKYYSEYYNPMGFTDRD